MGGVCSGRDALELIAAGASAVALGTVLFTDPQAPARIRAELAAEAAAAGVDNPLDGSRNRTWQRDELPTSRVWKTPKRGPAEKAAISTEIAS